MILGVDPLPEAITRVDRVGPLSSPPQSQNVSIPIATGLLID